MLRTSLFSLLLILVARPAFAADPKPIDLWPSTAPGEKGDIGEEKDMTKPDPKVPPEKYVTRLGNVTKPQMTIFKPAADKDTGAAIVVCPGGGYSILAYDLEGTEICKWLNSFGVTGVLLKYRVPSRKGLEKYTAALQDVQRCIGLVRHQAKELGIDPKRIGVLGFSAGGHLSAAASNIYEKRTYDPIDDADKESCRPDFAVLVYPAYLASKEDLTKVSPELKITKETPPTIIIQTQDDPIKIENTYAYALACKAAKVPCEVHVYAKGGHGYGMRPGPNPVSTDWPKRVEAWMEGNGWLKR
jgi:acetyl esterase/lipase